MKVAYYGPTGTYTEEAAKRLTHGQGMDLVPINSIPGVIRAVERGEFHSGVVPLENIIIGEVAETLDALVKNPSVEIIAEKPLKIAHCLGALATSKTINKIFSKDEALRQVAEFLDTRYSEAERIPVGSTAASAEEIKKYQMEHAAAVASEEALGKSGLKVIHRDLVPRNRTRFILVSKQPQERTENAYKTWVVVHPPQSDQPGKLSDISGAFSLNHINLEVVHSRPDGKDGYHLHFELEGHKDDEPVKRALKTIGYHLDKSGKHSDVVRVLGSYKDTRWKKCELT